MNNKFYKIISIGILVCLIIIALKEMNIPTSIGVQGIESIEIRNNVTQIAPNKIAVIEGRTILVYIYNDNTKTFDFQGSFNYSDYLSNPQKYGIPVNQY